jgi:hypothetical protein
MELGFAPIGKLTQLREGDVLTPADYRFGSRERF